MRRRTLALTCKRGHGNWFIQNIIQPSGKIKKCCTYIMGYKMKGDSGTRVVFCCDAKGSLPSGYIPLTELI